MEATLVADDVKRVCEKTGKEKPVYNFESAGPLVSAELKFEILVDDFEYLGLDSLSLPITGWMLGARVKPDFFAIGAKLRSVELKYKCSECEVCSNEKHEKEVSEVLMTVKIYTSEDDAEDLVKNLYHHDVRFNLVLSKKVD